MDAAISLKLGKKKGYKMLPWDEDFYNSGRHILAILQHKNTKTIYRSSRKLLRTWNVLTFQEAFHIISPPFCGFPFGKFHYHMFHFRSQSKGTGESNLDTLALSELLAVIF